MYTLSIQKVNWFFSRNYLLSLTRSNEGYKFIKCDCWRWKMCLRLKRKKIANQFYLELSSKRARACCKQLREFQWGEENIHYVEQDLFIHAQIFRQQFFNSFRAPHSPILALSIEWLASLPSLARSIQLIWVEEFKRKILLIYESCSCQSHTYMVDERMMMMNMRWRKLLCNLRKNHLRNIWRESFIYHENSILFIFFAKTFPSNIFIALPCCDFTTKTKRH